MQPQVLKYRILFSPRFNPHPTRRLDATCRVAALFLHHYRFNPHPTRRLDATLCASRSRDIHRVSILIQPEGWMQRPRPRRKRNEEIRFQSSSNPKVGCNAKGNSRMFSSMRFNPHPTRRLDATSVIPPALSNIIVSILIQPEGWMQLEITRPGG